MNFWNLAQLMRAKNEHSAINAIFSSTMLHYTWYDRRKKEKKKRCALNGLHFTVAVRHNSYRVTKRAF